MSELKLKCYSCEYERVIGERELITDLQDCPECGSEDIEIVASEETYSGPPLDPLERERIVKRRMWVIGVIGFIFLMVGIPLVSVGVGIVFIVVGFLCLVVASGGKLLCGF